MTLSQEKFEQLITNLKMEKTESAILDCKVDLSLDKDGDKASFIRDIAALGNNVNESYLLIGIEDKKWLEIGLSGESPLLDADRTQNRMNQLLENKIDPQIAIRYQVFELRGKKFGVVSVLGDHAPYIISIDQDQYGGEKTKGKPCHINRGSIYARHGDTTIIINRQSRIYDIQNTINTTKTPTEKGSNFQKFIDDNAYSDTESLQFGRNQLSQGLVERVIKEGEYTSSTIPAQSWLSILFYPTDGQCKLVPNALLEKLQPDTRIGRDGSWFHGLPSPISEMLYYATATPKGILGKWIGNWTAKQEEYSQAINILPSGIIHFVATYPLFYQNKGVRFFSFVTLIGYLWQLIYLSKAIYSDAGYSGNVGILLNFSGTKGTVLADLAKGPEKFWIDVFDWRYTENPRKKNQEVNFQVLRELKILESSHEQIEGLVRDISKEIGHYYSQSTPQCFTPDTNEFPTNQYLQNNNW